MKKASSREYLEYVLEQICGVELSYKKMMGEYLLYANGVLFGGIYDDRLLFKPTEKAKKMMPQAGLALPYPGAKMMLLCDFVDDGERLSKVIQEVTREKEMTRLEIEGLIEEKYGVTGEKPWMKYPSFSVFRHEDNKKWFAVIMTLDRGKFGIDGEGEVDVVNLKCDTDIAYFVRQERGVYPAYHMNKEHWISVILDENTDRELTEKLLDMSVDLTAKVLKRQGKKLAKLAE